MDSIATTDELLEKRDRIIRHAFEQLDASGLVDAVDTLRQLEFATIDERTLDLTDPLLERIAAGRTIVATFDPGRIASPGELVMIYGNYPHMFENLVVNNPVKRHVADFFKFRHDRVESDERWSGIDRIFILNMDDRPDRLDGVLRELALARAPLDRTIRHSASVLSESEGGTAAGAAGCMLSHINVLQSALDAGYAHTLVLEDDFCFSSDLEQHLDDLKAFVDRRYDYWVCLVSTSKYGTIVPRDDLVATSHQVCTNAGGYLVSHAGAGQVLGVFRDALEKLIGTGLAGVYAPDRCWAVLQPSGKFLVFRRKFGFQNSSFSGIERAITRYLD